MANNPFDRTIINLREKPLSRDINQAEAQIDRSLREIVKHILAKRASTTSLAESAADGFLAGGFHCEPAGSPNMTVTLKAGVAFKDVSSDTPSAINSIVGLDDLCSYKPIVLLSDLVFTVPTAPGVGQSRIDIIEVKTNRLVGNPDSRLIFNPTTGEFDPTSVNKTVAFIVDGSSGTVISPADSTAAISYKQGVAAATGSEVEPSVTTGYMQVARVNVGPTVTSIAASEIVDRRKLLGYGGVHHFAASWRVQWNAGTPIHTLMHMEAPPSIHVGLASLSLRGAGTLYVVGGEIAQMSCVMTVAAVTGFDSTDRLSLSCHSVGNTSSTNINTVDAAKQTALAAMTPPINVGIGTKVGQGRIISRFLTNTGASNNTDTSLEDAVIQVVGQLAY